MAAAGAVGAAGAFGGNVNFRTDINQADVAINTLDVVADVNRVSNVIQDIINRKPIYYFFKGFRQHNSYISESRAHANIYRLFPQNDKLTKYWTSCDNRRIRHFREYLSKNVELNDNYSSELLNTDKVTLILDDYGEGYFGITILNTINDAIEYTIEYFGDEYDIIFANNQILCRPYWYDDKNKDALPFTNIGY
jgi:hypothetical protein